MTQLPDALAAFLQQPRLVQLTTLERGTGAPFVNTISWVLAHTPETVRLVGDTRTQFMQNLRHDGRVALTVLGAGTAWTVYGQARVLAEGLPGVPVPTFALVEVSDLRVHEVMFWGARLTQAPQWEVTYSPEEAAQFDEAVFRAMAQLPR